MTRKCVALSLLAFALAFLPFRMEAADPPRLVVVLVVDQLRSDYLTRFSQHWERGFKTLLERGAVFERAAYPYLNTVTCAGHATIATGTFPRTHGMILNAWWHRAERATTTCTDDAAVPDISYGRESKLGNSAKRLLVPTLADEIRAQKPGARVVTLSLKARSAIPLAGHGGDAVTWFDEAGGSFVTSRAFAPDRVKEVQDFIGRNPFEKDLGRTWALAKPPAEYRQRDSAVGERPPASWTGLFPHPVNGREGVDDRFFDLWQTSPLSDAYLGQMAAALVDGFTLGRGPALDFLGVSFSALDLVGHDFGPDSREVEDLLIRLDATVGALLDHLDARVGPDNYVLALSADHGVAPISLPGTTAGRIATEDLRERLESTLAEQFGPLQKGTYVDAMNFPNAYLAAGVFERLRATPVAMRAVEQALLAIPGVARVIRSDRLSAASSDPAVRAAALSHADGLGGDLVVLPKPYWYLGPRNSTSATTHGTSHPYDTAVPVILFGSGIAAGKHRAPATPADIAPTLAHIAGVRMSKAEGHVLRAALATAPVAPARRSDSQ